MRFKDIEQGTVVNVWNSPHVVELLIPKGMWYRVENSGMDITICPTQVRDPAAADNGTQRYADKNYVIARKLMAPAKAGSNHTRTIDLDGRTYWPLLRYASIVTARDVKCTWSEQLARRVKLQAYRAAEAEAHTRLKEEESKATALAEQALSKLGFNGADVRVQLAEPDAPTITITLTGTNVARLLES